MFDLKKLVRKNILGLEPYSSARAEYTGDAQIFLDANENPFGTENRYPDPEQHALKEKIAMLKQVPANQIFIGNGSDEIIDLAIRIFCDPGKDKVLSFTPTYGMYRVSSAINNIAMLEVPLNENFQLDLDSLDNVLADPEVKIVFLCSPNNPTGNRLYNVELVLQKFKGIVLVDEAYIDFCDQPSMLQQLSDYPQLIVIQTLSKAWGRASARIGIAYASAAITALFTKTKPPYNISTANQLAAIAALSDTAAHRRQLKITATEKENLEAQLSENALITKIYPSDANFLLVKTIDAALVYEGLLSQGIVIRNRSNELPGCVRISIGKPLENKKLIVALKQIAFSIYKTS